MDQFTNKILIIHTQEVTSVGNHKQLPKKIHCFSPKISNNSKTIDSVINGFIPNDGSSHLYIFDNAIFKFLIRQKCIEFSNTSHVDIFDRFRGSVVDKVKSEICISQRGYD